MRRQVQRNVATNAAQFIKLFALKWLLAALVEHNAWQFSLSLSRSLSFFRWHCQQQTDNIMQVFWKCVLLSDWIVRPLESN